MPTYEKKCGPFTQLRPSCRDRLPQRAVSKPPPSTRIGRFDHIVHDPRLRPVRICAWTNHAASSSEIAVANMMPTLAELFFPVNVR
jgi:hypothetical protein